MQEQDSQCPACGASVSAAASHCPECGCDLAIAAATPARKPAARRLLGVVPRLVIYGALIALPILGFMRLRVTGPGPNLETTLRWMISGDGGRAATLLTLHREYEIATATARYAVKNLEAPSFSDNWAKELQPFSTIAIRGWLPLLFSGADATLSPPSVRAFYEIRPTDGWGHRYHVQTRTLERGEPWAKDPQVKADLEAGLKQSFFAVGHPDFKTADWMRLQLASDGPDGVAGTGDDIVFISYFPLGHVFRVGADQRQVLQQMDRDLVRGRQLFRYTGSRWDLIDARLLVEYRLDSLVGG